MVLYDYCNILSLLLYGVVVALGTWLWMNRKATTEEKDEWNEEKQDDLVNRWASDFIIKKGKR